jgi:hypothetical protein
MTQAVKKGFDTMNEQQPRAIWGLNFLQDINYTVDEITGAYDPEQEVWIMQGQAQSGLLPPLKSSLGKLGGDLQQSKQLASVVSTRHVTPMATETSTFRDYENDYDLDERRD